MGAGAEGKREGEGRVVYCMICCADVVVEDGKVYGREMRTFDMSDLSFGALDGLDWRRIKIVLSSANLASRMVVLVEGREKSRVEMAWVWVSFDREVVVLEVGVMRWIDS